MALYTSAEAAKLLRSLKDEEELILAKEREGYTFEAALGENTDDVRPDYSFNETCEALYEVRRKIITIKHAVNVFNSTTKIFGDTTIDMALIMLPQLSSRKRMLSGMLMLPDKKRNKVYGNGSANVIDYTYANFSAAEVKEEYERVSKKIDDLQLALDKANTTITMEIDI